MSVEKGQLVSALLDGDVQDQRQFDELLSDKTARDAWQRYALIGGVMRADANVGAPLDISQRVAEQVAQEPLLQGQVVQPQITQKGAMGRAARRWLQPAAKVAVAAGVAAVAVLSVNTVQQPNPVQQSNEPAFITNPIGGLNPVSLNAVFAEPQASSPSQAMQQQQREMQSYIIDHQQQLLLQPQADVNKSEQESEKQAKPR